MKTGEMGKGNAKQEKAYVSQYKDKTSEEDKTGSRQGKTDRTRKGKIIHKNTKQV